MRVIVVYGDSLTPPIGKPGEVVGVYTSTAEMYKGLGPLWNVATDYFQYTELDLDSPVTTRSKPVVLDFEGGPVPGGSMGTQERPAIYRDGQNIGQQVAVSIRTTLA